MYRLASAIQFRRNLNRAVAKIVEFTANELEAGQSTHALDDAPGLPSALHNISTKPSALMALCSIFSLPSRVHP